MKRVTILGSTGSIGTQTLQVILNNSDKLCVDALVAFSNGKLLQEQCCKHGARYSALISVEGKQCLIEAVKHCDIAVIATRGIVALEAVLYCIDNNIDVAIANKEVLVTAGALIIEALKHSDSRLLPVDSEHSAIWQCLYNNQNQVSRLYLTASGGALYNMDKASLYNANAKQALQHPNWSMGAKITIDSATMMNKALEVVEAYWLFGVPTSNIDIVVHRQSIVHSMVQFADNSILAQMSMPDMRLAIQYALLYPNRATSTTKPLDIFDMEQLTFARCDYDKFPCASLSSLMLSSPLMATVVNSCNDVCVEYFLQDKLLFGQIYDTIIYVSKQYQHTVDNTKLTLDNIQYLDDEVKQYTSQYIMEKICNKY